MGKSNSLKLETVVAVATAVRRAFTRDNPGSDLKGYCGECSYMICDILGDTTLFREGQFNGMSHCWVELRDGTIVDVTVTQFNHSLPHVFVNRSDLYESDTWKEIVLSIEEIGYFQGKSPTSQVQKMRAIKYLEKIGTELQKRKQYEYRPKGQGTTGLGGMIM